MSVARKHASDVDGIKRTGFCRAHNLIHCFTCDRHADAARAAKAAKATPATDCQETA